MGAVKAVCCATVVLWAAALSLADLRRGRLPNPLTVTGAVAILIAACACGRGTAALAGAVTLAGPYLAVHVADPAGLGGGDVKLAMALGALTGALGPEVWLLAALGAPLLTAVAGMVAMVRRRAVRSSLAIPHGPSMCVASLLAAAPAVF